MNKPSAAKKYTTKYALIQGAYWPAYFASASFAAVFLLSRNFTNSQIGFVMAASNIVSVFLQPLIASFADTTDKISLKKIIGVLTVICSALMCVRFFLTSQFLTLSIVFVIEMAIIFTLQPLVNSLGMQMINHGIAINFGLARGIGSMSCAIFSYIIGYCVEHFGSNASVVLSFIMILLFLLFTLTFAPDEYFKVLSVKKADTISQEVTEKTSVESLNIVGFVKHHKRFTVLLVGIALSLTSHMLINNYFIQIMENVGGNAEDMGLAMGIAAAIELPAMAFFSFFTRKFRCSSILKFSFGFFIIKTVFTLLAVNVWMLYFAQLFQFFAYALFIPASIYYVNMVISQKDMVKGQSFVTGAISVAGVLGSLIGGIILDGPGVKTLLMVGVIISVLGFAICLPAIERTAAPKK